MQKPIWLLAFLPYLHWFGSLVDGASVLTSPTSPIRILQPQILNISNGILTGIGFLDKERGPELPAVDVFEMGLFVVDYYLAPEEFWELIPSQAWSQLGIILGMSAKGRPGDMVPRGFVIFGIYFIFLLMKYENDFRSGVFEIQYAGYFVCDIVIFTAGSSGLKTLPSFAHVTQLAPPPSPINTNSSSQLVASALGAGKGLKVLIAPIDPPRPLDRLDLLISILGMVVTVAQPPGDERVQSHIENTVSGVTTSISPVIDARPPNIMTYEQLISAARETSIAIRVNRWALSALRIQLYRYSVYLGELTMVPSNSSAPTSLERRRR